MNRAFPVELLHGCCLLVNQRLTVDDDEVQKEKTEGEVLAFEGLLRFYSSERQRVREREREALELVLG